MKNYLKISFLTLLSLNVFAQNKQSTFKKSFSGSDKKIYISSGIDNLTIEGITGTEVILESDMDERNFPAEAEGLKLVTLGAVDNTGIGANVSMEGNIMKIKIPKVKSFRNFVLKIPNEININVTESGNSYGKWQISNMKGDVETQTSFSTLNINNVSGPIVAHGGWGKIYVVYDQLNQSKPNSISASGPIDVTLPADTKANLKLQAHFAEVFSDFDIQPVKSTEKDSKSKVRYTTYNNQTVYINGNNAYDRWGKKFPELDYNRIIEGESAKKAKIAAEEASDLSKDLAKTRGIASDWSKDTSSDDCNCQNDGASMGIINGGGVSLSINSSQGNIFLRKKK